MTIFTQLSWVSYVDLLATSAYTICQMSIATYRVIFILFNFQWRCVKVLLLRVCAINLLFFNFSIHKEQIMMEYRRCCWHVFAHRMDPLICSFSSQVIFLIFEQLLNIDVWIALINFLNIFILLTILIEIILLLILDDWRVRVVLVILSFYNI